MKYGFINTFKYHVSCANGKISVRCIYFYYIFSHRRSNHKLCFLSCKAFVVNVAFSTDLVGCWNVFCLLAWAVDSWSLNHWLLQLLGFEIYFCCLVWAVDHGVERLDILSFDLMSPWICVACQVGTEPIHFYSVKYLSVL